MKIWLRINGFQPCSWTFVWYHLKTAFEKIGCDIPINPMKPPDSVEDYVELWWCDPQNWSFSNASVKLRAGIALSEARSILTKGRQKVIDNINACDLLFCPAESAAAAFREAPIETPIHVVPFGVNGDKYSYIKRDWSGTLRFLLMGNTQFRKGSWLAPAAFLKAFTNSDDVQLTIACFAGYTPMYAQLKSEYDSHPQIKFTAELKDSPIDYYREHHVLLSPHLSEGFGLTIPEAMATGMVAIISRCSAPREFFSKHNCYWIEMSEDYAPVSRCLTDTAGYWRIPDVNSLAEQMRAVYDNRESAKHKGRLASVYVLRNLTWEQSAVKMTAILKEATNGNLSNCPSL